MGKINIDLLPDSCFAFVESGQKDEEGRTTPRSKRHFLYKDKDGNINDAGNPNGSIYNIAGISNTEGNVIGMMPHPERAVEDLLGSSDGLKIFESIVKSFTKGLAVERA